jgi:Fic family protein
MPAIIERTWAGDLTAVGGRKDKRSFRYQAFVPDPIADIDPEVTFEAAELALLAEEATKKLNSGGDGAGLEAIGPLLLRSEAVASSRIEGYSATSINVAKALLDPDAARGVARTIARNIEAMREAIAIGERAELTVDHLLDIHRTLMQDEPEALPGEFRATQGWIGGRAASPMGAAYIPPPEDRVPGLADDLLQFMARDDIPPIAMAAIAHAQLETIHPFADGNGRVGRCLIHAILRRAQLTPLFVPPVSIVLAARPESYIAGLVEFREGGIGPWVASFSEAVSQAATEGLAMADEVDGLRAEWFERSGRPRRGSSAARLLDVLPETPILSASTASQMIGASPQRTLDGLKRLASAGVVAQISRGTWDRQYAAQELFDLVATCEARIAGFRNE